MKKSKIEASELTATTNRNETSDKIFNKQVNISVDNTDVQTFEMLLKDGTSIKSLVTLTIYNWQFSNSNECFAYPTTSHIWNSLRCADNNRESAVFYYYLTITNIG